MQFIPIPLDYPVIVCAAVMSWNSREYFAGLTARHSRAEFGLAETDFRLSLA